MTDDKTKRDKRDSSRVAANEDYEVAYFAKQHGLSRTQTLDLIRTHGNDRAVLNAEAEKLKAALD